MSIQLQSIYRIDSEAIKSFLGSNNLILCDNIFAHYDRFKDWNTAFRFDPKLSSIDSKIFITDLCKGIFTLPDQGQFYAMSFEILCDCWGKRNYQLSENEVCLNLFHRIPHISDELFIRLPSYKDYIEINFVLHRHLDEEIGNYKSCADDVLMGRNGKFVQKEVKANIFEFCTFLKEAKRNKQDIIYFVY